MSDFTCGTVDAEDKSLNEFLGSFSHSGGQKNLNELLGLAAKAKQKLPLIY